MFLLLHSAFVAQTFVLFTGFAVYVRILTDNTGIFFINTGSFFVEGILEPLLLVPYRKATFPTSSSLFLIIKFLLPNCELTKMFQKMTFLVIYFLSVSLFAYTTIFRRIAGLCFYPKSFMLYINGFVSTSSTN